MTARIPLFVLLTFLLANGIGAALAFGEEADVLLKGGLLHLGDGLPATVGDVAIRGDRIVGVGKFELTRVGRTIDCSGLIISPGFIDLHNHSDRQVRQPDTRAAANYLFQGCTTMVTGNCGSGPMNVKEYYDHLEKFGVGPNIAHLIPQGQLRRDVIGSVRRSATKDEVEGMRKLAAQAMHDGAWGMSTGLIYVPSSYADTEELSAVVEVVGQAGGIYVSHIRNEGSKLLDAVEEAIEIGRRGNAPVHISHFKSSGKNSWGLVRIAAQQIEKHREAGMRVTADQYPYTASSTSLDATMIPSWARAGGRTALKKRIDSEDDGPRIRESIQAKLKATDDGQRIQIASYRQRPEWAGRRLREIATEEKLEPLELVLQIVRSGGASVVNHSINEADVRHVMNLPWVATASDGSSRIPNPNVPHPRSYGTFSRKLGHYALREKALPLPLAIRSSTGLPADILGMKDRGYLRVGSFADIAVWSADEMIDRATFAKPHQYSDGIRYLFVNGKPTIHNGRLTGALHGRPLRRPTSQRNKTAPKTDGE